MAGKRTPERDKIIARIESEISLRKAMGFDDNFISGMKATIALIDPEYFKKTYLDGAAAGLADK